MTTMAPGRLGPMSRPEVVHDVVEARSRLDADRAAGRVVGLVPTMGALHDGHESLVRRAAEECDRVVVTIFVNPTQFGANEDFTTYPRTLEADLARAQVAGAHLVVVPSVEAMYPGWPQPVLTTVRVAGLSEVLEGASRPGHFDGVATVVSKLFQLAGPCRAYFGEKDWQQLQVVRRMARDLLFPVAVIGCDTVREDDGLALSSRNAYLTAQERADGPVLHRALSAGRDSVLAGERTVAGVQAAMAAAIGTTVEPDYLAVVDSSTLVPVEPLSGSLRLLVAARFGRARLIDNLGVEVPS